MRSVAIITATTGHPLLRDAVTSVDALRIPPETVVEHWIVVDGAEHASRVDVLVGKLPVPVNGVERRVLVLPVNTGGSGYVCHRIIGSIPWVCSTDYVCFLDEDNAYDPDHLVELFRALDSTPGARWAHSLRTIVTARGDVVCRDNCESLGGITHTVLSRADYLVDTNCYLLERGLAIEASPLWHVKAREEGKLEGDRAVCKALLEYHPNRAVSRRYTVRYRVNGRADSVRADFFVRGNALLGRGVGSYDFGGKPDVYLFHFDAHVTHQYISGDVPKHPLAEWCMTLWSGFHDRFNVLDGFANASTLPRGATCLVAMCHPSTLPLDVFASRKSAGDARIILYTAEGPNKRHAAQWDAAFLAQHFTHVITFWEPLIQRPPHGVTIGTCPHNSRFLEFPRDMHMLRENANPSKSMCMVLERRDTQGCYDINGVTLRAQDYLREMYVQGLRDITVFGGNWASLCAQHPGITLGHSGPRAHDPVTSVDHLHRFTFALIIENCDAEGYVSEKFGDALIACTIPIYYGTPSARIPLPEGTYIDLRQFSDGFALQAYVDALTPEDIARYRRAILEHRVAYLEARGSAAVYDAIRAFI